MYAITLCMHYARTSKKLERKDLRELIEDAI